MGQGRTKGKLSDLPQEMPILPLRNSVFFPGAVMPLTIGRSKTIRLMEEVARTETCFGIATQKTAEVENPSEKELYRIGTVARVIKLARSGKDGFNAVVEGIARFRIDRFTQTDPFFSAQISPLQDQSSSSLETDALTLNLRNTAREVIDLLPEIPVMAKQLLDSINEPGHLADLVTANLDATIEEKQQILEAVELKERLNRVIRLLNRQHEVLKLSNKINTQVKGEMSRTQREYYLRQQLKAIREELGEREDEESGLEELQKRLEQAGLSPEGKKAAQRELRRMRHMQPSQAEYTVARTYLDWLAELPWNRTSADNLDLSHAMKRLDADHYGLEKIKNRIIQYLAVRKLKEDMKGPILCFLGPPGVGKTSLGRSIASALDRRFHRISLGGVRDEAEIRGHRRTYIGALPGRIIQGLKKAGTNNPVFLLDEIDKVGHDFRGDPSSALLEVLDPEQNHTFSDHYLDIPFDLSKILFIATANQSEPIPAVLRDRMEIIELSGYTLEEKINIAVRHLIPKQLKEHGISDKILHIPQTTISRMATGYTREAGVRNLERQVAATCRQIAVEVAKWDKSSKRFGKKTMTEKKLEQILGPEKFYNESAERTVLPGVATGLAWTPAGGDLLFVEATRMGGKGTLTLTGQLGDVMKESAQTALSWIRSQATQLGLAKTTEASLLEKTDLHVHVPAGAIPKDGPSAGVTIISALVSLLTDRRVRPDVAMTGEVTLQGLVLPVGGVKEKVLAAHRAGIKTIVLPARNEKDLTEIPANVRKSICIKPVKTVTEVLQEVLMRPARASSRSAVSARRRTKVLSAQSPAPT
ncbi:MAG: endopeptidase La [Myxococcota bacterium]